jgi:TupA-like ATPgrasp
MAGFLRAQIERLDQWKKAIARVRAAYIAAHSRAPKLIAPRRYTEKIQWRKLFDMNPVYAILCDKLAVRSYIAARIGEQFLVPLLWSGQPDDIPFEQLPAPFVLKSNHASGHFRMISGAGEVDQDALRREAAAWIAYRHGVGQDELGYDPIPPRILAEQTVVNDDGERPEEVRVFVFDGKAAVVNTVFVEEGQIRNGAFHTPDWTRLDWHFTRVVERGFGRPKRLDDIIELAEQLGRGLDHVRVDFYDCGERIYIGEMTLYSWSGHSRFAPDRADVQLGAYWRIEHPLRRALRAVLFGRREIVPPA